MTALLASVASFDEVENALTAGADIIDLKDPEQGALGAWALTDIVQAVRIIAGRRPVSAAAGDPTDPVDQGQHLQEHWTALATSGVDNVKFALGFDGYDHHRLAMVAGIAWGRARPVAVIAVDQAQQSGARLDDPAWLAGLAEAGCQGVMLDTADKTSGRLTDYVSFSGLSAFITASRDLGLMVGLAGSLGLDDVALINRLAPDIAGFRGALCAQGDRNGRLSPQRLRHLRAALYPGAAASQATATAGPQMAIRVAKSASRTAKNVSPAT